MRSGLDDERGRRRGQTSDLRGTIEAFDPNEDVGEGGTESRNANGRAAKSARAVDAPLLGVGTVSKRGARRGEIRTCVGKLHVEAETHVVGNCGNFPEDIVGVGTGLMEL